MAAYRKIIQRSTHACERKHFNSGSAGNDSFSLDKFEDHITSLELSFTSLSVELVRADIGGNIIKPFLTITAGKRKFQGSNMIFELI